MDISRFSLSRFDHQRKTKNATMIPNAIPPNIPPTIAAVFGGVLLLPSLAIELVCAEDSVVLVAPGAVLMVLMRVKLPPAKEGGNVRG